ncbi:probable LRR receptor-like serine/threonine-protein kinase At3g47570 [Lotus japonicus]|uniref:probable LRR receptor-like serine/threonine-protein kinase At3g47570 n=1 Tax=Lotus japonicus TaxID=34305 RepID=UPI00258476C2|nr:probable LRR receptor-like serine/threonine-protein kinase At3g47570 [Lotus japonicus]
MKLFPLMFPASLFWLYLILFTFKHCPKTTASISRNQTDHLALLKFKEQISYDPYGILDSWNHSTHFCMWHGITCSSKHRRVHRRVTELSLTGYQLHGSLSPHVGNLSFLTKLYLQENNFHGNIPQELGRLVLLQVLYLTNNSFTGEIPTNLTTCFDLKGLGLGGNNLTGQIPIEIGSLQKLQVLELAVNNLTGEVLPFIGNLSFLTYFLVRYNNLEGNIPEEICRLKNLAYLQVSVNKLSGTFPPCFYNMSSLILFSAGVNEFDGSLPPNMFHTLPNLKLFIIGGNRISGPIPTSLSNASNLDYLEISENNFIGQVPSVEKLQHLRWVQMFSNHLGNKSTNDLDFLKSLTNCSKLQHLVIADNNFGGPLPNSVGNLSSQLSYLGLGYNYISGKIPVELGNLINLTLLDLKSNHFEGTIPVAFGKFQKMQLLDLGGNKVSGDIPASLGNLTQLFHLGLEENNLEGNIPPSIGNCQKLQFLNLSRNNLKGTIPVEVFNLSSLTNLLDLSHNSLSGSLPKEVGRLKNIDWLDVSENQLSGDIPGAIGECMKLEYLYLQGNSFHGIITSSLPSLKGLIRLDLSRNRLSGSIPKDLQNISYLEYFNVSFNMLEGEVPTKGVFQNVSALAMTGNKKLCGGIPELHLLPCPVKSMKHVKHHSFKWIAVVVSLVVFLLMLSFVLTIYWMRKRNKKQSSDTPTIDQLAKISYHDLHHGTGGFSAGNLIGSGSFGSVYKGNIVSADKDVAIKVLNLQKKGAHKSFIVECNALKNIRHRNLVKILTCCSSTDNRGQDFKALVFEYMKNGSLEQWLHPGNGSEELREPLDLEQRLSIIVDVASALHYLHQECEQVVLHCDIKPSNVLLDEDMVAHVSDFGIARLVSTIDGSSDQQSSTIGIKGTLGYAAPEYGVLSEVSTCGDIYSFGILVLEMLTGRRPTDELFEDGQNLHKFVEISFPDNLLHILDPRLVSRLEEAIERKNRGNHTPNSEKCLISLFRIGLACSMESPRERMKIVDVIRELNIIKKLFLVGVPARVYAA